MNNKIRAILIGTYKSLSFLTDILQVIGLLYFIFGIMGIYFFGGSIHSASNELYEERYGGSLSDNAKIFNFNDYYHCFMILFMIMFTGWGGYDKMVTLNLEPTGWYNIYFVGFFFFSNIIFLNILIGFLCGNTDAIMNAQLAKL